MTTFKRIIKALKDHFKKGETGDIAFMEFKMYGIGANPQILNQIKNLANNCPTIDLEKLNQLPQGTLGYEYAQHMKKYNIKPLELSSDLKEEASLNPFALRFVATHDIFHILLDFDTSYPGEAGVFGFAVAQNYSKMLSLFYPIAMLILFIMKPNQIKKIWTSDRRGKQLGKQAKCLLTFPFEENWKRPIEDLRLELGLV